MKTYEIHNLTTNEVIADNLKFEDLPELFDAYVKFFPEDDIVACYQEYTAPNKSNYKIGKRKFYREWFNFMEELLIMDNIH